MGLFEKLFGGKQIDEFAGGRGWTVEVVGELQFQENLLRLYRTHGGAGHDIKVTAALVPEPSNKFDLNAVRVDIDQRIVGYLTRAMAAEYRAAVGSVSGHCGAKIVGGFQLEDGALAHFGVRLNISWPPRLKRNA